MRASGVEVGKVTDLRLVDRGKHVQVDFAVDRSLPLYQSTTAHIRYANLIGDRYLELSAVAATGPTGSCHPATSSRWRAPSRP